MQNTKQTSLLVVIFSRLLIALQIDVQRIGVRYYQCKREGLGCTFSALWLAISTSLLRDIFHFIDFLKFHAIVIFHL